MRKLVSKGLLLVIALIMTQNISATDFEVDGNFYSIISMNDKTVALDSCKSLTNLVIPEIVTYRNIEFSVYAIGNGAFRKKKGDYSIVIPASVKAIGNYAFYNCKVTSITIPESVKNIGTEAFRFCNGISKYQLHEGLDKVNSHAFDYSDLTGHQTIPSSITYIGEGAFEDCKKLTSLSIIGSSETQINKDAFKNCTGLTSLSLQDMVMTSIGEGWFRDCSGLRSVTFPATLQSIGDYAFAGAFAPTAFVSLVIPDGVQEIGSGAFGWNNCSFIKFPKSLKKLGHSALVGWNQIETLDLSELDSLTSIDANAFGQMENLKVVKLPNSVTEIGENAFNGDKKITSIALPNSLKTISKELFYYCTSLYSVHIPSSVRKCEADAFVGCSALKVVDVADLGAFACIEFKKNKSNVSSNPLNITHTIYLNGVEQVEDIHLVIPDNQYVYIYDGFAGYKGIVSVEFPGTLSSIADNAFSGCPDLESVIFKKTPYKQSGKGHLSIGKSSFKNCKKIKSLVLPDSISYIGEEAFYGCTDLQYLSLPMRYAFNDIGIMGQAFAECINLDTIVSKCINPPAINSNVFGRSPKYFATLIVPIGTVETYKTTEGWKEFYNIKEKEHDETDIPVTLTANSYSIEYGDEIPTLGYTSEGANVDGDPLITCKAGVGSSVGTYDIVISKGTVKNYNDHYVNGTLTITKAPLVVSVDDYCREEGQENPAFEVNYEGWKLGETESVLITAPIATTAATKESPAGDYAITVSGGKAQNYKFEYINGTLIVLEVSGINEVLSLGCIFDIYTTKGTKIKNQTNTLDGLPKGVYIINKKKVFVK